MSEELLARGQMAYSLAFHIIFAAIGMTMPLLMVMAEHKWRKTGDPTYLELAKKWAKGTAVFFAIGAVSGTALSFELGLLFPRFMELAGPMIGMPFSMEGFAFFLEAIFLGIYLYGWERVSSRLHFFAGIMVALCGTASAVFVTFVNAWMNAPVGFRMDNGVFVDIDPIAAMGSPAALHQIPHTVLAAYMSCAFAVAGIHAWSCLKRRNTTFHSKALAIALTIAIPTALLQPVLGHFAGQRVAKLQPMKLAAMEGLQTTQANAPLKLGPIEIPGALSFMAFNDTDAVVQGLDAFPAADHPPGIVHVAHQTMVALGSLAALFGLVTMWLAWRKQPLLRTRWWLKTTIVLAPSGLLAMEAGWIVTEVGRQPWTIYGILRTKDAVTPVTGLWIPFAIFAVVYAVLGFVTLMILRQQLKHTLPPDSRPANGEQP